MTTYIFMLIDETAGEHALPDQNIVALWKNNGDATKWELVDQLAGRKGEVCVSQLIDHLWPGRPGLSDRLGVGTALDCSNLRMLPHHRWFASSIAEELHELKLEQEGLERARVLTNFSL